MMCWDTHRVDTGRGGDVSKSQTPYKPFVEQKAAIGYGGGLLQAIACAGAGKTEAFSLLVSALIYEGVDPAPDHRFHLHRAAYGRTSTCFREINLAGSEQGPGRLGQSGRGLV